MAERGEIGSAKNEAGRVAEGEQEEVSARSGGHISVRFTCRSVTTEPSREVLTESAAGAPSRTHAESAVAVQSANMSSGHANDSGGRIGSGDRPQTMLNMNRQRDAAAAAAAGGAEPERDWSQGGRLRHVLSSIPLATLLVMITNFALYAYELSDDSSVSENCITVTPVIRGNQWARVLANAYFHLGAFHIGMNMMAWFSIASSVESTLGSLVVLGLAASFNLLCGLVYLTLNMLAAAIMRDEKYMWTCAAGYSGIIFGFLILDTSISLMRGVRTRRMFMCEVPIVLYPFALLIGLSLLMPSISFMGHLAGVIVGAAYVKGFLLWLSIPRPALLWIQDALPSFITSANSWRATPTVDPFDRFHPECLRGPFRCRCPSPPDVEGVGCANLCVALINIGRRLRGGGGGQRSGGQAVGRGAGGRGDVSAQRANALAARAAAGAAPVGGAAPGAAGLPASPSRSAPLLDPPARSFPALPSVLMPPPEPSAPALALMRPSSQSFDSSSSDVLDGAVGNGGSGGDGGEYSRLLPSADDSSGDMMQPPARSAATRPPPRLGSPTPSAPLLEANDDIEMQRLEGR